MIVRHANFVQEVCPGAVADFTNDCQADQLAGNPAIVAFPRDPKPHEVTDRAWVRENWL